MPGAAAAGGTSDRKQREIYVGNLAIGVTSPELLQEFFNKVGRGAGGGLEWWGGGGEGG